MANMKEILKKAENLSEKDAEIFMQSLCKEGKAILFANRNKENQTEYTPLTLQEITEHRQEINQRKQKFAAMKEHIINPKTITNTENGNLKPFINNYLEQRSNL